MAWRFREIDVSDIKLEARPRTKYKDLYDRVLSLRIGKGFEIETDSKKEAENIRNAVSSMLKRKGLSDKYIASNRLNKFYCGRTK